MQAKKYLQSRNICRAGGEVTRATGRLDTPCSKHSEKHEQQNDGDWNPKKPGNDGHGCLLIKVVERGGNEGSKAKLNKALLTQVVSTRQP